MAALTPRARAVLLGLAALYAAAVIPIQARRSGDLVPELGQSERLLRGAPLYGADNRVEGVWWPPFSALALVPFALLARASLALTKVAWTLFGVACLAWSVARIRAKAWGPVALAVAAVAVPIQTNVEHANINAVLLALVVAAAVDLADGRDARSGLWIGIATALKAFPGLLLAYLAYRRRWRAFGAGIAAAAGLTALALLPYGPEEGVAIARNWLALTIEAQDLVRPSNQSLAALVSRLGGSPTVGLVASLACVAAVAVSFRHREPADRGAQELAIVTLLAVLISPIAWVHYYVLLLPAWVAALDQPDPPPRPWWSHAGLATAALATSGFLTVGPRPLRRALLDASIYAWGAVLLLLLLLVRRPRTSHATEAS